VSVVGGKSIHFGGNNPSQSQGLNRPTTSVRDSIRRASVKFEMNDGSHAGDLVLENERLKTTLVVLN
jgi:hypothetical protein